MVPYERIARMTESAVQRVAPGVRLAAGVVLVFIALVAFGASRLAASSQRHAFDPRATPVPTYEITAGKTYQLSSSGGVKALTQQGVLGAGTSLTCTAAAADGATEQLTMDSTKDDVRDLHVFATFTATQSGSFHFACAAVPEVFVDDAEDSAADLSALLVLLATVIGLVGIAAVLSGAYDLPGRPESDQAGVQMAERGVDSL
jgi:hypothetical protein